MIATAATAVPDALPDADDFGLRECDQVLAQHLEAVERRFGPVGLGVIDLPALQSGQLVPEQIRVCGVLYWASEVEQAGLLPFVEALAEGVMSGSLVEPLGGAIPELSRFWRAREQRFAGPERRALFGRLFGDPSQFVELVRALSAIGREPLTRGTGMLEARVAVLARQVGLSLSNAGAGIAAFAARDIVAQIRTALRLMQHPDLVRVLGGGGPWQLIARHAPRLLGRPVSPHQHLARASSGLRIIGWIATEAATIDAGVARLPRGAPVIRDAEAWSAASGAA